MRVHTQVKAQVFLLRVLLSSQVSVVIRTILAHVKSAYVPESSVAVQMHVAVIATAQTPAICYCQKLSSADVQSPHGYMGFGAKVPLKFLRVLLKVF